VTHIASQVGGGEPGLHTALLPARGVGPLAERYIERLPAGLRKECAV
jgi:hypothetical protein